LRRCAIASSIEKEGPLVIVVAAVYETAP
jgi:hypothetical protein